MNHPAPINLAFNKAECQQLLTDHGIPIPDIYVDHLNSFKQLLAVMDSKQVPQAFIKPAHSSSASGIITMIEHSMLINDVVRLSI